VSEREERQGGGMRQGGQSLLCVEKRKKYTSSQERKEEDWEICSSSQAGTSPQVLIAIMAAMVDPTVVSSMTHRAFASYPLPYLSPLSLIIDFMWLAS
jgi:hypothetical protein